MMSRVEAAAMTGLRSCLSEVQTLTGSVCRSGLAMKMARTTSSQEARNEKMAAEKMPWLAANFFGPEPFSGLVILKAYLERKVASGELEIDDLDLAARQFMDLAMAGLFKRRLYCIMSEEPDAATIGYMVGKAVDMFLAYYGRDL